MGRRIGEATAVFNNLRDVWKNAGINKHRKIEVYNACVVSKLLFSLECEALRKSDKSRVDAFHCRCLRRILKVAPSWISHVPNNVILAAADSQPLSERLAFQQVLFGKIAKQPNSSFIRQLTFEDSSINPTRCVYRRRGRPRLAWQSVLHGQAIQFSPHGDEQVSSLLLGPASIKTWKQHVRDHL